MANEVAPNGFVVDEFAGVDDQVLTQNGAVQDDATGVDNQVLTQNGAVQDDATGVDQAVAAQAKNEQAGDAVGFVEFDYTMPSQVSANSNNAASAIEGLNLKESQRLIQKYSSQSIVSSPSQLIKTLDQTSVTKLANQRVNALTNTNGQKSPLIEKANKNNQESSSTVDANPKVSGKTPVDNPLHEYATYTYNFCLFALTPDDYNNLAKEPKKFSSGGTFIGNNQLLIASGGVHANTGLYSRNSNFTEDFYFENFKIETVIGLNARGRGANAYDISFTVIEPMGFTLFNRLLTMAKELNTPNYLEMPFLLKIDFYGNSDAGELLHPLPNQTKYIAIKLIECKTQVTHRGAEYQFRAVPYNHQAFTGTVASTPAHFSVTATKIKDFFDSTGLGVDDAALEQRKKDQEDLRIAQARPDLADVTAYLTEKLATQVYTTQSYTAAFNQWLRTLKNNNAVQKITEIEFKFDPVFENSVLIVPKKQKIENAPMTGKATNMVNPCADKAIRDATTFEISAGTDVLKVIDIAMQNSEFIREQMIKETDPPDVVTKKASTPLKWYKVRSQIELKDFDFKTNKWSKKITYVVTVHEKLHTKHSYSARAKPEGAVKKYEYIYTGKNRDILDLKLDFDMTFYVTVMVDRNKNITSAANQLDQDQAKERIRQQKPNSPQPLHTVPITGNQQATASGDMFKDSTQQIVADVSKNIYTGSRGDMINVQMRIVGDPEFIKQDDLFLNPSSGFNFDYSQQYVSVNKEGDPRSGVYSLNFDSGDLFAELIFKTPVDYDDQTGMLKTDGKYTTSVFSGIYQIVSVTSEFKQGKFEQVLNLVRIFDQDDVASTASTAAQDNRNFIVQDDATGVDQAVRNVWADLGYTQDDVSGVDAQVAAQSSGNGT